MKKTSYKSVAVELAHLRSVLKYWPRKGVFTWKVYRRSYGGGVKPGDVAGTKELVRPDTKVYRIAIIVDQHRYRAHRLAYLFMKGKWPKGDVDHEDGDGTNNKWKNLRPATRGQNNWNNHNIRSDNKSGKAGVSWSIQAGKWTSRVTVESKIIHLGYFVKLKDAIAARRAGELKYFGKYAPK